MSGYDSEILQRPDGYEGVYQRWNIDMDGDGDADSPWDMGSWIEYPILSADIDGDGEFDPGEFGDQESFR